MRVLITGGAGFIGSHLAEALLERHEEVVAFDDLSTGSRDNILHLGSRPGFRFRQDSILDEAAVDEAVAACDAVYHLAAAVGVRLVFEQAVRTIETNVTGTQHVLASCVRHGRKVFVASTSEVYGRQIPHGRAAFREEDDLTFGTSLRWGYAASKALDEFLALAYAREQGLRVVVGRFFNTVGPRQSPAYGMVVPRFIRQALRGEPITVYGDGTQVRSFTWVENAVRAVTLLMETVDAEGGVFNIGSGEAVTIRDLAERVRRRTGSRSEIVMVTYEEVFGEGFEDVHSRVPDLTLLQETVALPAPLSLDEIIDRIVDDVRRRQPQLLHPAH